MAFTWLKQFGLDVLKGIEIIAGVAPLIQLIQPGSTEAVIASDFEQLFSTIQQVEIIGAKANLAGPQKLETAIPIVTQQVLVFLKQRGFSVRDQNRFAAAMQGLTSVLADTLNAVETVKSS